MLLLIIAVGVAHHQVVAVLAAGGFNAMHHRNRIGVANIGHQHADQPGTAALKAAGHLIGAIAELVDGLLDTFSDGRGQQGPVFTDKARHAGLGDASALGNIKHGHAGALGCRKTVHGLKPFIGVIAGGFDQRAMKPVSGKLKSPGVVKFCVHSISINR